MGGRPRAASAKWLPWDLEKIPHTPRRAMQTHGADGTCLSLGAMKSDVH